MPLRHTLSAVITLLALALSPAFGQSSALKSHADLDWSASRRWIHVDNVDSAKAVVFEYARKNWLAALRKDDHLLGDGRPLFWHAERGKVQTFFTFYPFGKFADMDTRRDMAMKTDSIVGQAAVDAYDTGDSALVPPHYSEMWRRASDFDIFTPDTKSLSELSANFGRLEIRHLDELRWEEFPPLWKELGSALATAHYSMACRAFANMFGHTGGQYVILWLASDSATYRSAPTLHDVLSRQIGAENAAALMAKIEKLSPVVESYEVRRRPDLSNLGR